MNSTYYMFNWLDAHGINSLSAAEQALSKPALVEELREVATQANESPPVSKQGETTILAGRGLDLTGKLECNSTRCRQRQVHELFRKAWHYFDRIIVDDVIGHQISHHWDFTFANPKASLLSHIEVLLYLQEIGAENLVEFREKPEACTVHPRKHAIEAGLQGVLNVAETFVSRLAGEAQIRVRPKSRGMASFIFQHPKFEIVYEGEMKLGGARGKPTDRVRKAVVREMLGQYIPHLTADVRAAKSFGVPLGSTVWLHGELLSATSNSLTPDNVAFNLDLPVLQGIPIEALIKIRRDEYESFQRFRDSLRLAIKERLNTSSSLKAEELSEEIRLDVIEPELRRIRDRLAVAEATLAKKTALGIFMGALVTTCGVLAGVPIPISIAAGCGTATTTETGAVTKYLEEKQQNTLSDMYFLWKAIRHVAHDL